MEQNCIDSLVTAYRSPQWKVNCIGFVKAVLLSTLLATKFWAGLDDT